MQLQRALVRCIITCSMSIVCYLLFLYIQNLITKTETACDLLAKHQPLDTTRIVNPHPYVNTIVPQVNCEIGTYLVVYVHSAPQHHQRRSIIRRTWGNVTQYQERVRLVFVIGMEAAAAESTLLDEEIRNHTDILQSNFIDTYRNLSIKAIAGLKWITENCRSARYVLKTDDDTFVNMYLLLRLLEMATIAGNYGNNALVCNECYTAVNRVGKWKTTMEECSITVYPTFCQGVAFVMSMDVAIALYKASHYVPLLWMDDVYITGILKSLLPVKTVNLINAETFYMSTWSIDNTTSSKVLSGTDAFKFIYYHMEDVYQTETAWNQLSHVVRELKFKIYSESMFSKDMQLERDRLKGRKVL